MNKPTQTIEQTSKSIKAQKLIAFLLMVGGFVAVGASDSDSAATAGMLVAIVGALWFLGAVFLGWWRHG